MIYLFNYETTQKNKLARDSNIFVSCFRNLLLDKIHFLYYKLFKKMSNSTKSLIASATIAILLILIYFVL